jgi:hypothetical protein
MAQKQEESLYIFFTITAIFIALFFLQEGGSGDWMYIICAGLGFGTGFWAIFVTMAAEQFGTNLRATAATTVPNMVRGALPLIILLFKWLRSFNDYVTAGLITGIVTMAISIVATILTDETFGKDLNYVEEDGSLPANEFV